MVARYVKKYIESGWFCNEKCGNKSGNKVFIIRQTDKKCVGKYSKNRMANWMKCWKKWNYCGSGTKLNLDYAMMNDWWRRPGWNYNYFKGVETSSLQVAQKNYQNIFYMEHWKLCASKSSRSTACKIFVWHSSYAEQHIKYSFLKAQQCAFYFHTFILS